MNNIILGVICLIAGYLFGSINPAIILSKAKGKDVRTMGSGNAGATNMLRNYGKASAVVVLLCDVLKCVVAVISAGVLSNLMIPEFALPGKIFAAAGCIMGHNFPLYFGFKGGKGVVVSVGTGTQYQPMLVSVGQVVWYGRYSGSVGVEIEIGGEEYILIHENNIYAIDDPDSEIPTPIYDMVVIKPIEREDEVTECGIIIPGTARDEELTHYGEIMAVGSGQLHRPMSVEVGETAIYTKFRSANGVDVVKGKNRYIICRESEIYAVM